MYEYTCPACGKIHRVLHKSEVKTYCNKSCAVRARYMKPEKEEPEVIQREADFGECLFNPVAVDCYSRNCANCGWNPVVAKARSEAILSGVALAPKHKYHDHFGDWISVDDRLPQDGVQVLGYTQAGRVMSVHYNGGRWCAGQHVVITHWTPMPEGPKV